MRWGAIVGVQLLLTGCSVLFDVDSLKTDKSSPEAGTDAGTDAITPIDATATDTGSSDSPVSTMDGGGSDAKPDGRWCDLVNPAPNFCDDFDVGNFGGAWMLDTTGGGSVTASTMGLSVPNAEHATTPGATSVSKSACLNKYFNGTWGTVELGYDLYVVSKPNNGGIEVGDVGTAVGNDDWYAGIILGPQDLYFFEHDQNGSSVGYMSSPMTNIPLGQWKRVEWQFRPKAGTATLVIGGQTIFNAAMPSYGWMSGQARVTAGIVYEDKSYSAADILVDNVVVRMSM